MTFKDKLLLSIIIILLLGLFIFSISEILLPFVVAIISSYFLSPAVDKLQKVGIHRAWSASIIISAFFSILVLLSILLLPLLYEQFISLINQIPEYIRKADKELLPSIRSALIKISPETLEKAQESVSGASVYILEFLGKMMANIWSSGLALVNLLALIFVTPVVMFYILRDWVKIVTKVNSLLPPKYATTIRKQCREIDITLSGYIRGQTNVCLLLGIFYALGLTMAGLNFGFVIGLATGIFSFIPYVGLLFGFAIGIVVAIFQFAEISQILIVAGIFILGQFIEGNFVSPKLVGDKVGLHPVWIIFGMLSGGAMFGFIGILLAIPVTAIIGVLVRFALDEYLNSPMFIKRKKPAKAKA
ncbi:MAG: family transporter [Rickettsiaceae bacterium]|jgi:predicted PurR-regulated permease PerM|nr:family transporter [Rickettsiaceae bacterium]